MKRIIAVILLMMLIGCGAIVPFYGLRNGSPKTDTPKESGIILVNMTPAEVIEAWGYPSRRISSGGAYGQREMWVYSFYCCRRSIPTYYLYFEEGLLKSWDDLGR